MASVLETQRLRLRPWRDEDIEPFAALNADRHVMEFMPKPLTLEETTVMVGRIRQHFDTHGFGLWAVEVCDGPSFIGFVGLSIPKFTAHFTPCVEIGWRLAREQWGHGYATEAAHRALGYGFGTLSLEEIVSFTTVANGRSRSVMERLGMSHDASDDFDHPSLAADHPLRPHVLYRQCAIVPSG